MNIELINTMSSDEKRWFAHAMIGMVYADGSVDLTELEHLKAVVGMLASEGEINEMVHAARQKTLTQPRVKVDQKVAFTILKQLARLSISDGKLSPSEIKFFKALGLSVKFPPSVIEKVIETARKTLDAQLPTVHVEIGRHVMHTQVIDLTKDHCCFRFKHAILPKTWVTMQFYGLEPPQASSPYEKIFGTVTWSRPSRTVEKVFIINAGFSQVVRDDHGILQIIYPSHYVHSTEKSQKLTASNKSLMVRQVTCICGEKNIPFWLLRSKSVTMKPNIFGIPKYEKPTQGYEPCDYNLIQNIVCPKCYFTSNDLHFFVSGQSEKISFDIVAFLKEWKRDAEARKKKCEKAGEMFGEERSLEQALLSYDLGIETYNTLLKIDPDHINYTRKITSFLMIQSELLMNAGQIEAAHTKLKEAIHKLESVFSRLDPEVSLRSASLLYTSWNYLKDQKKAMQYMNFVMNYNKDGKISKNSNEFRAYQLAEETINRIHQDSEEYTCDQLKNFHLSLNRLQFRSLNQTT